MFDKGLMFDKRSMLYQDLMFAKGLMFDKRLMFVSKGRCLINS